MPRSISGSPVDRPADNVDPETQARNRLQLLAEWLNTTDVQISVVGHVDMSTAHQFTDYVFRRAGNCKRLVLDMTRVTFFDCAGFSALYHINERCRTADVRWTVRPADCVARVVRMCDPFGELSIVDGGASESACA